MASSSVKVEWNTSKVIDLIREMAQEQESAAATRIWANAIRNVPIGRYGRYRYQRARNPLTSRGKHRSGRIKKDWVKRSSGSLMKSLKRVSSKYKDGGTLVWAGNERLIYYSHFVEFGTVYMQKRRGYRFLTNALNKEKRRFVSDIQDALAGDMNG